MNYRDQYENWKKLFASDEECAGELASLEGNEKEIEDRFYRDLSFGTAGMRGVLAMGTNRMNIYTVRRATQGLANTLSPQEKEAGVVIGYDSRRMSSRFATETALVLCANGVQTMLFDALRPVALLSYGVRHLHAAAGIVITASHNPPEYNGYKVYGPDGAQLGPEAAEKVTAAINALGYADVKTMPYDRAVSEGLLHIIGKKEVDDPYTEMVKKLSINPEACRKYGKDLKIVYTPIHGSGNVPVRRVLSEMGLSNVSVVKEQEAPDPDFSTVAVPNPEYAETLRLGVELADRVGADAVFGTDPDCDRLGVAVRGKDGKFIMLSGNQVGCLLLYYIVSSLSEQGRLPANGAAVKSIVSTELARAICKDFGVELYDVLTGFKFIGEKIQSFEDRGDKEFLFGFEESCGYLSGKDVRDKDAVNASLLLAEAAAYYLGKGKTLCDVMEEIYRRYGTYRDKVTSVTLPGKDGVAKMEAMMSQVRKNPPKALGGRKVEKVLDILDGTEKSADGTTRKLDYPSSNVLCFYLEGGCFVCLRPSGTEPKIKLYVSVNAPDAADADKLLLQVNENATRLME